MLRPFPPERPSSSNQNTICNPSVLKVEPGFLGANWGTMRTSCCALNAGRPSRVENSRQPDGPEGREDAAVLLTCANATLAAAHATMKKLAAMHFISALVAHRRHSPRAGGPWHP